MSDCKNCERVGRMLIDMKFLENELRAYKLYYNNRSDPMTVFIVFLQGGNRPISTAELRRKADLSYHQCDNALRRLVAKGFVERTDTHHYQISQSIIDG